MSSVAEQLNSVLHKTARLIELCNALQEENEINVYSNLNESKLEIKLTTKEKITKLHKKRNL